MTGFATTTSQRGFTIIEVMVALVIAALGLSAVTATVSQAIDNSNTFQDRTFAMYIGINVLTELRLSGEFPELRETSDEVEYANRRWIWTAVVSATDVDALRRVDINIALADAPEDRIKSVVGFVGQPVSGSTSNSAWTGLGGAVQ